LRVVSVDNPPDRRASPPQPKHGIIIVWLKPMTAACASIKQPERLQVPLAVVCSAKSPLAVRPEF